MSPLRSLLQNLIDYAGLFPPSALPMPQAVENYQRYRDSSEAWMLARFVVPVSRLDELEQLPPVPVSALIGGHLKSDLERIARSPLPIEAIELRAADASQFKSAMRLIPSKLSAYFEVTDLSLIPVIHDAGARAKIRTGGITPEAFPEAADIAGFLKACAATGTPFKATAGLHHPVRCHRPLTYSAEGPSGWMYGFLNVFFAAVLARKGAPLELLQALLIEESPAAFTYTDENIAWNGHPMTAEDIVAARRDFAISFGSCSFEEPVAELKALKLI